MIPVQADSAIPQGVNLLVSENCDVSFEKRKPIDTFLVGYALLFF